MMIFVVLQITRSVAQKDENAKGLQSEQTSEAKLDFQTFN